MKKIDKKGFTLIELLAVIVMLAIVAAVAFTFVVPQITGQAGKNAITSVKTMVTQINQACAEKETAEIMEPAHGNFSGLADPCTESSTAADKETCLAACQTGNCTISFTAADLTAMKLSGDMPNTFTATMNKCNITSLTAAFTGGSFDKITVSLADGTYSYVKATGE